MPRQSNEQKNQNRSALLRSSGRALRRSGFHGVGVDAMAAEAGQTSGAFYTHFRSKDEVFAAVLELALSEMADRSQDDSFLTGYLSPRHIDNPEGGCALPALLPDVARAGPEVRGRFAEQTHIVVDHLGGGELGWQRLAVLVGAVALARALPEGEARLLALAAARKLL